MPIKIKIPVKIGSHLTHVSVNDKLYICDDFIRIALIQCNLIKCANEYLNTYSLFERLNGIEVMIDSNENMFNLWSSKWSNLINDKNFSLIIKKYKKSELLCKLIQKNEKRRHKLFEVSRQLSIHNIPSECEALPAQNNIYDVLLHNQNTRNDKLKMRLKGIAGLQEHSTSDDSGTTRLSGSSGTCLIKKAGKISDKKKFLKKFLSKTDAHAKSLLRNLSNTSFISQISKPKSVKFENSYHHYEEINESNLKHFL